jgi:energy-coupling factor transporter transmembrane protein EcfT
MAMALEARGFQSRQPRTFYQHYHFRFTDLGVLLAVVAFAAGYLYLWSLGLMRVGA